VYARRIDDNQNEVVAALRKIGATVRIITQGDGLPDLLVGFQGRTYLMELKDGNKPPSARRLTEAEEKFHSTWAGGSLYIVTSAQQAVDILMAKE